MNWFSLCLMTLGLWGTYTIFGSRATKVHGEKVTMMFEGVAMLLVGIVVCWRARADFGLITWRSAGNAALMGIMSAVGLYIQLVALRLQPNKVGTISMITGLWPVITVIAAIIIREQAFQVKNLIAAALAAAAIVVASV